MYFGSLWVKIITIIPELKELKGAINYTHGCSYIRRLGTEVAISNI